MPLVSAPYRALALVALLLIVGRFAPLARASDYSRNVGGNFDDPVWTRDEPGDADYATDVGPPGAGDTASISGGAVTATGGSVKSLGSTVDFIVNGNFSTGTYVSTGTLQGSGTLTASDIGPGVTVQGGNLVVPSCTGTITLEGGTFLANTFSATDLSISAGGKAAIAGVTTDLNASVAGGGSLTVPGITNGRDETLKMSDAGSTTTVSGKFSIEAGFLDVTGGTLKVDGALLLDGGKDVDGNDIGGGGNFTGADVFVSVGDDFVIGLNAPSPGFGLGIAEGAVVSSNIADIGGNPGSYGVVGMSGAGTIWKTKGLAVGESGTGNLKMDTGAQLQLGSGSAFAVGLSAGGQGSLQADGTGTVIDARQTLVSFGKDANSQGSVILSNGASLLLNENTFVGDSGNGGLSIGSGSRVSVGGNGADLNFGVGNTASGAGSVSVEDAGSRFVTGDATGIIVGVLGNGFFGAGNGGTVQTSRVAVGTAPKAKGQIVIDGAGTTWTNSHQMGVGGNPIAGQQGPGSVTVQNSAEMRVGTASPPVLFISRTGQVILDGTGKFAVGTGAFGAGGTLRISAPGILLGQGRQTGTAVYNTNVTGNVIVGAGGRFQPGGDPDVFSIKGNCDLSDGGAGGGETDISIAGAGTAGTDYDQLVVSGNVTLGGTLNLVLLPGYVPKVGDAFNLVHAGGTITGGFPQVVAPGLTVSPVPGPGGLIVTVTGVSAMSPPAITSATAATASVGAPFSYQITATNLPSGYAAAGLPGGLTLDAASGLITGTPTAAGTFQVGLSATNVGGTGTATLTLTVGPAAAPGTPVITSAPTAAGQVGVAFSYQIAASNGPMGFGASGLPAGLTVDSSNGLISGTPTVAGTFTATVAAANAIGKGLGTLTLTVAPATVPTVTIMTAGDGMAVENGEKGRVVVRRTGDTSAALTVRYKVKGSAQAGVDYKPLPGTVTIPAGSAQEKIKIKPLANTAGDGTRLAKIKLLPATDGSYDLGTPAVAKVKIIDND